MPTELPQVRFAAYVPSVEGAVILKTYAWAGRRAAKDAIDLHSLFRIVDSHPVDTIGGWRLDESPPVGARRDTSRTLHELARNWEARPPKVTFDYRQLVSSIRTRVVCWAPAPQTDDFSPVPSGTQDELVELSVIDVVGDLA